MKEFALESKGKIEENPRVKIFLEAAYFGFGLSKVECEENPTLYHTKFLEELKKLSKELLSSEEVRKAAREEINDLLFVDQYVYFTHEELQKLVSQYRNIIPDVTEQAVYDVFARALTLNPHIYGESWDHTETSKKIGSPEHVIYKSRDKFVSEFGIQEDPEKILEAKREAIVNMLIVRDVRRAVVYLKEWGLENEKNEILKQVEDYLLTDIKNQKHRNSFPWGADFNVLRDEGEFGAQYHNHTGEGYIRTDTDQIYINKLKKVFEENFSLSNEIQYS